MNEGNSPPKRHKNENRHNDRIPNRMEEQIHEVKEAILYSCIVVDQVPHVLEDQRDQVDPDTGVDEVLHIISVLGVDRFGLEALVDDVKHGDSADDQDRKPEEIAALVLTVIASVVLYLHLDEES